LNCPTCGKFVPYNKLLCEECVIAKSKKAYELRERELRDRALAYFARGQPLIRYKSHLQPYRSSKLTLCDVPVTRVNHAGEPLFLRELESARGLCEACRREAARSVKVEAQTC
jgi:hypothetical protein